LGGRLDRLDDQAVAPVSFDDCAVIDLVEISQASHSTRSTASRP
jgi:hypothetical protein